MATTDELVAAAKIALGIQAETTALDAVLRQKVLAVVAYLRGAGVTDQVLAGDLAVGTICLGVTDLWDTRAGEAGLSKAFHIMAAQLITASGLPVLTSAPADGATGVPVDVVPALTFDRRISSYSVRLVRLEAGVETDLCADVSLDITERILIVTPAADLAAATEHALVVEARAASGPSLPRTVIRFTTA